MIRVLLADRPGLPFRGVWQPTSRARSRRSERRRQAGREQPPNRVRDGCPGKTGGLLTPGSTVDGERIPQERGTERRGSGVGSRRNTLHDANHLVGRSPAPRPREGAARGLRWSNSRATTTAFRRGSPRGVGSSTMEGSSECTDHGALGPCHASSSLLRSGHEAPSEGHPQGRIGAPG
jgi:hypothetical protein